MPVMRQRVPMEIFKGYRGGVVESGDVLHHYARNATDGTRKLRSRKHGVAFGFILQAPARTCATVR
jgi:hypothetical protein